MYIKFMTLNLPTLMVFGVV